VSRLRSVAAALAGASIVLELVLRHSAHPVFPWHAVPGFDLVYGFLGCVLIVVASKALGRVGLQRPDSYYGPEE